MSEPSPSAAGSIDGFDVEEVHGPPARRSLARPAAAAVLVVLVGGIGWAAVRDVGSGGATNSDGCPPSAADGGGTEVPSAPSASGTTGRIVPDRSPTSVLLCEYVAPPDADRRGHLDGAGIALRRTVELAVDGPLVGVLRRSAVLPPAPDGVRACAYQISPFGAPYLIRLRYGDGVVWVATPAGCGATTNGVELGTTEVLSEVRAALGDTAPAS